MQEENRLKLHPSFRGCRDQMLTMVLLIGLDVYLYGPRPAIIIMIATVFAVICDLINALFRRSRYDITDLSSVCFAWVFALMMPASCNYLVVMFGTIVTVMLGKWVFGGWGGYPFHPACFGFAMTAICYSSRVFLYPKPFTKLSLGIECTAKLFRSPSQILKLGGTPTVDMQDLIVGDYSGPMGTTFFLILIAALILLIVHREFSWHASGSFILACALWAFLFPRISAGHLRSLQYEVLSGGIAFAAVYLVNEPTILPKTSRAKLIYGASAGIFSMLFTRIGVYALGTCFALLIMGPLSTFLDNVTEKRKVYVMSAEEIDAYGEHSEESAGSAVTEKAEEPENTEEAGEEASEPAQDAPVEAAEETAAGTEEAVMDTEEAAADAEEAVAESEEDGEREDLQPEEPSGETEKDDEEEEQ